MHGASFPPVQGACRSDTVAQVRVSIRNATRVDVPSVMTLWEEAAENDARPADSARSVETLLARDSQALFIAEMDGRIVGSVIAGWDGWRAHLYRLAVHPDARRRGVGGQLLVAATERLTDLGATRLDAMVLESNDLGQSIWRSEGFASQKEWRRWVRPIQADSSVRDLTPQP
ncbi:GNAT family N-acetyltransferase [Mumia sp. zg.B17]|nr:GNAT family N-acetyltransferase [Mumia sp. zg.B17]